VIEPFDIDLVAEAVAALVTRSETLVVLGRHRVVAVEVHVAADADVLDRRQLGDVVDVIEHVLDRRRFLRPHEHADARDAHDPAGRGHLPNRFVGLAARMSGHQGAAVRMRDQHRAFADLERVERRAVAAVRDIDGHPGLVHARHDRHAEIGQTVVAALGGSIADQIARVIGQLRDPLAGSVEQIDVLGGAEVFGVLKPEQDANAARPLNPIEIRGAVDPQEPLILVGEKRVPRREELHALRVRVGSADPHGDMEHIDARLPEGPEVRWNERVGIGHPASELREVQRERAEHVDHRRPLHQVDGARGILFLAGGKEPVPPAAHERGADRGDADVAERDQDVAAVSSMPQRDTFASVKTPLG
jgi:hypothetical protein